MKRKVYIMEKLIKQLMEQMNKRFDTLEQGMKELKEEIDNTQIENRSYFKHIESQLEQQQRTFQVVSDELKGMKIDIEYLSEKTGKHDAEINNLNRRIQS